MPFNAKRSLVLAALTLGLLLLVAGFAGAAAQFPDIVGHWAEDEIMQAANMGIIHGYPDGLFRPDDFVIQEHFGIMLQNAGLKAVYDAAKEVTTRQDAARFIVHALGKEAEAQALSAARIEELLNRFGDRQQISAQNLPYVAWTVERGIFKGVPVDTFFKGVKLLNFDPNGSITRAQAAILVTRLVAEQRGMNEYVGSKACMGCHSEQYLSWEDTLHPIMIQDAQDPANIVADFSKLPEPEKWLPLYEKARFTIGSAWKQRFLIKLEDGYHYILPYQWNQKLQQWQPYHPNDWQERPWEKKCAGCHTTGFNPATERFAEPGVGCEACHGPGYQHVISGGDRSKIVRDVSVNVCASCHNRGKDPVTGRGYPTTWSPGEEFTDEHYDMVEYPDKHVWPNGWAKGHHQQYLDWRLSAHAGSNEIKSKPYAKEYCMECHSAEYALARSEADLPATVAEATTNVNCNVCHDPHSQGLDEHQLRLPKGELCQSCHNGHLEGLTFEPGKTVHHGTKEFSEGVGAIGVDITPGLHWKNGVDCVDCHMTKTAKTINPYDISNHVFEVVTPELAAETGMPDSCTSCHAHQDSSPDVRQSYIDFWQDTTQKRLDEVKALLEELDQALAEGRGTAEAEQLRAEAYTNITFLESDGSMGFHNFEYALKVLAVTKAKLQEALSMVK